MRRLIFVAIVLLILPTRLSGAELLSGLDTIAVTPPNREGIGTITLSGNWLDTCVPNSISHSVTGTSIDLILEHDGINVGCGDAITPWSLTEQLGPLAPATYTILGTLYAVDPLDRTVRQLASGPDVLVESYAVPEPSTITLVVMLAVGLSAYRFRSRLTFR